MYSNHFISSPCDMLCLSCRRMEKALCDLPLSRTTDLARDIALGRNPADLGTFKILYFSCSNIVVDQM